MTWIGGLLFVLIWTVFACAAGPLVGRFLLRPLFLSSDLDETLVTPPPG